jgi:hypothetical protein
MATIIKHAWRRNQLEREMTMGAKMKMRRDDVAALSR